jgi:serine/threonine protein kinase/tetratricopeptide (TPR) repeat protein
MGLSISQMALMSRLLDEALPLDAEGRRHWLDMLSPEYESLADALREALLPSAAESELPGLDIGTGSYLCRIGSGPQPGELVGPYQLIRLLGEGGMAQVWLAERADGAFRREVALKLPMLLRVRQDLAARFARERDILAALEHPNIARLYDAGVSLDGLPYLAMEYVGGEPLVAWCDTRQLSVRERVKLFLQVLDAVQYAHAQGVIHRDIKPSNILVTDAGHVRLLDFGVAKLLAREDRQAELTQRYGRVLTPDYASPELVKGEETGAASDIYALGVVLYELLSGNRPYHLGASASISQLERAITTAEVKRPSTHLGPDAAARRGTSVRKLARRITGDLDSILLKALAKTPADRYSSASAFADDLQRTLSGEPVEARANHLVYRCGKFAARHRAALAAMTAATVLGAGTLSYLLTHPRVTESATFSHQAGIAAGLVEKSIAVLPFVDTSKQKDQEYFSDGLSEELIDHLVHSSDMKVIARTSSFQFKDKNEDVRSIAHKLGVTHVLEGSVRKDGDQLRITAELVSAAEGVQLWSQTYDRKLADIFQVQGEIADAVTQALNVALHVGFRAAAREPDVQAYNLLLEGRYFEARSTPRDVERAAELYERAVEYDPEYALGWARLAHAYMLEETRQGPPSEEKNKRVLDALDRAIRLDPNLVYAYYTRAAFEINIGWDWAAALADDERARQIDPRSDLLLKAFGDHARLSGQVDQAIALFQEALDRNPLDPILLDSLGGALCEARRFEACLQSRLRLLKLHPDYDGVNRTVGMARLYLGELGAALTAMQHEPNEDYRLRGLAEVFWAMGRRTDSDSALKALVDKYASIDSFGIAAVHARRGEVDDAFRWLDRAYRKHDHELPAIKTDPEFANLRGQSRFQALLSRMRLTDVSMHSVVGNQGGTRV